MKDKNLTRVSLLHLVTALVDHFLRVIIQFIMNPLILAFIGPAHFGLWQMLNRFTSYLNAPAGNPSQALRLIVARHQQDTSTIFKRKSIGAAMGIWLLMTPVFLIGGILLIFLLPRFVELPPQDWKIVKWTTIILVATALIRELAVIPMNVIAGMNRTYKLLGLKSGSQIIVAVATWLLLTKGYGLGGMAAAQAAGVITLGVVGVILAKRIFYWFGIECPDCILFKKQFKFNTWYISSQIIGVVNITADVLLIGIFISPAAVTSYVLIGFAPSLLFILAGHIAGSSLAAQGKFLSESNYDRFKKVRNRLFLYTWLLMSCGGCVIIIFNQSFLALWVGNEYFSGQFLNYTLVLTALVTGLIKLEEVSINTTLNLKNKVKLSALITAFSVAIAIIMARIYGVLGVAIALLIGRIMLFVAYHLIMCRIVPALNNNLRRYTRSVAATLLITALCAYLGGNIKVLSWLSLVSSLVPAALIICSALWILALDSAKRAEIRSTVSKLLTQLNTFYRDNA